jgi:hypothetical protein
MDPTPRTYMQRQAKRGGALVRRSELFEEVLIQLDSAAGEAEKTGPKSVAVMINEVLIPFIEEGAGHSPPARGVAGCKWWRGWSHSIAQAF